MAVSGACKVDWGEVFPQGLGMVGVVTALDDFTQNPAVTAQCIHTNHQAVLGVGAAYTRWWAPIWAQLPHAAVGRQRSRGRMNWLLVGVRSG
jgi:hypothetical protein